MVSRWLAPGAVFVAGASVLFACDSSDTGAPVASGATASSAASAKPAPQTPDDVLRNSIAAARTELPRIAATRRYPYYVADDTPAPAPSASASAAPGASASTSPSGNPDAPPPIVQVDGEAVLVDGKRVDALPKAEEPAAAGSAPPNAAAKKEMVTISTYGPPMEFPRLRKALASRRQGLGAGVAGLRIMPKTPADAIRGVLDALRREGYRDVYVQTTDPSKVALARVIEASGSEGVGVAEKPEWFLSASYRDGKASLSWGRSEKGSSTQKIGEELELAKLEDGLCANWKKNGQHRDAGDPAADALVVDTLRSTPEFVSSVLAAAEACKRGDGRPAFWVALRQWIVD
jgi:hypothetical protein